jgi:hypothetical protein
MVTVRRSVSGGARDKGGGESRDMEWGRTWRILRRRRKANQRVGKGRHGGARWRKRKWHVCGAGGRVGRASAALAAATEAPRR